MALKSFTAETLAPLTPKLMNQSQMREHQEAPLAREIPRPSSRQYFGLLISAAVPPMQLAVAASLVWWKHQAHELQLLLVRLLQIHQSEPLPYSNPSSCCVLTLQHLC